MSCGISPPFEGLSPTSGQVAHVLLTRLPRYRGLPPFAFDLHVLGTPPAFVLSQDQTLQLKCGTGDQGHRVANRRMSRAAPCEAAGLSLRDSPSGWHVLSSFQRTSCE